MTQSTVTIEGLIQLANSYAIRIEKQEAHIKFLEECIEDRDIHTMLSLREPPTEEEILAVADKLNLILIGDLREIVKSFAKELHITLMRRVYVEPLNKGK